MSLLLCWSLLVLLEVVCLKLVRVLDAAVRLQLEQELLLVSLRFGWRYFRMLFLMLLAKLVLSALA